MSKLRCGTTQRILPRVLPGIGAWQSSCTHGSAEAEKGLVIRCYKSVVQSTSLLRRPPPLFLFSVRDAAAYSCSDLLKSNKEKDIVFLKKRSFVSFFVPSFVFLAPFCLVERQQEGSLRLFKLSFLSFPSPFIYFFFAISLSVGLWGRKHFFLFASFKPSTVLGFVLS